MRTSATLSRYIGRLFMFWFASVFVSLLGVIFLLDTIELMRRAAAKAHVTLDVVLAMALLKLPMMAQEILPFAILFSGMLVFARLTRNRELVVARAAGISVWQFLLPVLLLALLIGVFNIAAFNPIASVLTTRFELMESRYLRGRSSLLAVSENGLWLRQGDEAGQSVVHAQRVLPNSMNLQDVIIFLYEGTDRFVGRIDAAEARLGDGFWELRDAWLTAPDKPPTFAPRHTVPTNLTLEDIQDSFAAPETMSFWELPGFIEVLESAGFSGLRHRLYWHSLLASPLLLSAMILIAATFTVRLTRHGGTALIIAGGVCVGFLLYFLSDLVLALGLSSSIPVLLAAWTPAGVSTLLGLAMLLHLEDG